MKKGFIGLNMLLSIVAIAIFLFLLWWYIVPSNIGVNTATIESSITKSKGENFFTTYLKTPIDDATIADYILYYHYTGDSTKLKSETSKIVQKAYQEVYEDEVDWKLTVGDKQIESSVILLSSADEYKLDLITTNGEIVTVGLDIYE